ncbi:MAG: helix-turn-helix domain-containing protein [Dysgonamonadaceae bacterium]|jgi:predicted transcriptional regulator|nr:helix-turn-helix domain-containing protein [Dysgonamonadaceae bacterium]
MNSNSHIGRLIEQKVKERGINMNDFAAAIHCSRSNAYSIFHRKSINIDLLQLVSEALKYDFVEIYNKSLDMNLIQKQCVVVLETDLKRLEELQVDASVHIVHSWTVSEI